MTGMQIAIFLLGIALYFLPTIIAGNHNISQVFIVNLVFGWTIIGWIIALVMGLKEDPAIAIKKGMANSGSQADELQKIMEMRDSGAITEKEFKKMKKKLL